MNRIIFITAFLLGAASIAWVASGFLHGHEIALGVTLLISVVYVLGALELAQFRSSTKKLTSVLVELSYPPASLDGWLQKVPATLQNAVRARIEGERVALPAPSLTPYLVGLLVMLGMLGTFLGMVVTLNGAAFSLESTSDLESIRAGLAAPIKGLGLAFGTSVAGVAASAILGLLSTLSRRERLQASQLLDTKVATLMKDFSVSHHRMATLTALQQQTAALPALVEKLHLMAEKIERTHTDLSTKFVAGQENFHSSMQKVYTDLASSIDTSLKQSLAQSGSLAGESIKPVLAAAMDSIGAHLKDYQSDLLNNTQSQLSDLVIRFNRSAEDLVNNWKQAGDAQLKASTELEAKLAASLNSLAERHQQQSDAILQEFKRVATSFISEQGESDKQRAEAWQSALAQMADSLKERWQQTAENVFAQQHGLINSFAEKELQVLDQSRAQSEKLFSDMATLLKANEGLIAQRQSSEAVWLSAQNEQMSAMTAAIRSELVELKETEMHRGKEAVAQLEKLQDVAKEHLINLGQAIDQPMQKLIASAAEAPRAAAEVIKEMRAQLNEVSARDNQLQEEKQQLMQQLDAVLARVNNSANDQRDAVASLVKSTADMLENLTNNFTRQVQQDTATLADTAAELSSGSAELAGLGDAFATAVQLFSDSNEKMLDNLVRIEATMEKAANRSDEQLAYYVAQAREIIDLSMMSQREIFEELRQLTHKKDRTVAEAV